MILESCHKASFDYIVSCSKLIPSFKSFGKNLNLDHMDLDKIRFLTQTGINNVTIKNCHIFDEYEVLDQIESNLSKMDQT